MSKISASEYILERLAQVGVKSIFGVPGDFNLAFLDHVEDHPTIEWVGCANELNAAYAADGYSRAKGTLGVLLTTFGVGELSAVNGIAGSFSEHIPVLHIVGVPSTKLQANGALLHHTMGDGRFDSFKEIYKNISIASSYLDNTSKLDASGLTLAEKIDHAIYTALKRCRPTYLTLPTDIVEVQIPTDSLKVLPDWKAIVGASEEFVPPTDQADYLVHRIVELYEAAKDPVILVDSCAIRFGAIELTKELIEKANIPFFTSPMGKSAINESHPLYRGVYIGSISRPEVAEEIEKSDFILTIGSIKSDFNTGSFSYRMSGSKFVELHSDHTIVHYGRFEKAGFHVVLPLLIKALSQSKLNKNRVPVPKPLDPPKALSSPPSGDVIIQDDMWASWSSFFRKGDIIIAETGTSAFGLLDARFADQTTWISQVLWGSIGFTGGAAFGAGKAANELGKGQRTLLFIGDGSLQLTVQEISSIVRHKLPIYIFVINNDGYVIERKIRGETRKYNDIQTWKWQNLLPLFSAVEGEYECLQIRTPKELYQLQHNKEFAEPSKTRLIEIFTGRLDAPRALRMQAELTGKANE